MDAEYVREQLTALFDGIYYDTMPKSEQLNSINSLIAYIETTCKGDY